MNHMDRPDADPMEIQIEKRSVHETHETHEKITKIGIINFFGISRFPFLFFRVFRVFRGPISPLWIDSRGLPQSTRRVFERLMGRRLRFRSRVGCQPSIDRWEYRLEAERTG